MNGKNKGLSAYGEKSVHIKKCLENTLVAVWMAKGHMFYLKVKQI